MRTEETGAMSSAPHPPHEADPLPEPGTYATAALPTAASTPEIQSGVQRTPATESPAYAPAPDTATADPSSSDRILPPPPKSTPEPAPHILNPPPEPTTGVSSTDTTQQPPGDEDEPEQGTYTGGGGGGGGEVGGAGHHIQVDPNWGEDEVVSVMGSDQASSTASLTASILDYRRIYGRTYQNFSSNTEYWGPNDETQNEGLDIVHNMLQVIMDGKLFRAPLENPQRVIDVGTGTGIWAMDFADAYPSAEVIGTDISPIQPSWVPPNLKFELDDAQLRWTFPNNHFDFIHLRALMGSIKDWPFLYSEVHRTLKPGAWFEHLDFSIQAKCDDASLPPSSPWHDWCRLMIDAGETMGRTFRIIDESRNVGWFRDAGFECVEEHRFKVPMGGWPRDPKLKVVGQFNYVAIDGGLEGYGLYILTNVYGWDLVRTQTFIAETRKAVRDKSAHVYFDGATVFGQKPLDA